MLVGRRVQKIGFRTRNVRIQSLFRERNLNCLETSLAHLHKHISLSESLVCFKALTVWANLHRILLEVQSLCLPLVRVCTASLFFVYCSLLSSKA